MQPRPLTAASIRANSGSKSTLSRADPSADTGLGTIYSCGRWRAELCTLILSPLRDLWTAALHNPGRAHAKRLGRTEDDLFCGTRWGNECDLYHFERRKGKWLPNLVRNFFLGMINRPGTHPSAEPSTAGFPQQALGPQPRASLLRLRKTILSSRRQCSLRAISSHSTCGET